MAIGGLTPDVSISIGADTTELSKGVKSATNDLQKIGKVGLEVGAKLATALAAAVAAVGALALKGVQLGDGLDEAATAIGITATELAGLRYSAQFAGVESEELDAALAKLARTTNEAAQGSKAQAEAFATLGLDANELMQLPLSEQMLRVADAMTGIGNATQKAALAQDIFGRSGTKLITFLNQGSDAIREQMGEAKEYGLFLDNTQRRVVAEAADAQGRMKAAFEGLSMQLGAMFGPAIEAAAEAIANLTGWVTRSLPKLAALAERLFDIKRAAEDLSDTDLSVSVSEWRTELEKTNEEIEKLEKQRQRRFAVGDDNDRIGLEINLAKAYERQFEAASRLGMLEHERLRRKDATAATSASGQPIDVDPQKIADEEAKTEVMLFELFQGIEEQKKQLRQQEFERMWTNLQAELDIYKLQEEAQQEHVGNMIAGVLMEVEQIEEAEKRKREARQMTQDLLTGGLADAFAAFSQHSKKMFNTSKTFAIAEAGLNAFRAIQQVWADETLPFYAKIAATAVTAIKTAANISAIKKTTFGGGTTPTVAGTPTVNGSPIMQAGPTQVIQLKGVTELVGDRAIVDSVNRAVRDGARLVLA